MGQNYEGKITRLLPAIAGQHMGLRNVTHLQDQLQDIVEHAQEQGLITLDQGYELLYTDLVFQGTRRSDRQTNYIVAEVSITASARDITRASHRAAILAAAVQTPVFPAVICEHIDLERTVLATSHQVAVIKHPAD